MQTVIPFGDPKAVKRWSGSLFLDVVKKSYFDRKFVSTSDNAVIQRLTDLDSSSGDTINFDLSVQLRNKPTYGDNRVDGKAENLKFFSDEVKIDQMRHQVSAGGRMSRKRTEHDLRMVAKDRLSDYWSKFIDEMHFIYLSGARGINADFTEETTWAGHASNSIQAPDTGHIIYGGDATAKNNVDSSDVMSVTVVEKSETKARMMRSTDPTTVNMLPVTVEGEARYVLLMSPFQEHSLRTSTTSGQWLDIQKAAAAAEGKNNPIFKGGLGMIKNVILHSHESVIRFSDYGSGTNLPAARALFLGRQAGVVAYGSPASGGMRFTWVEEDADAGNEHLVTAGCIVGVKKTRFNSKDFGVMAVDTYAVDPNA